MSPYFNLMFENIKTELFTAINNKGNMLFYLIFIIIFILLSVYCYNTFVKQAIDNTHVLNKEFTSKKTENIEDITILLFITEWCPYCKSAMPEWDKFKEYAENINNTNSYQIVLNVIDCDKSPELADKYEIAGYPSIKLIYKGKIYDYDAKPNKANLIKFLETSVDFVKLENDAAKKKKTD